jgi:hypothetical protein
MNELYLMTVFGGLKQDEAANFKSNVTSIFTSHNNSNLRRKVRKSFELLVNCLIQIVQEKTKC